MKAYYFFMKEEYLTEETNRLLELVEKFGTDRQKISNRMHRKINVLRRLV